MMGEWLTFRELSQEWGLNWNKLRRLRDSGTLTDLGMVLYQVPCHARSRWWIFVPIEISALCRSQLHSLPSPADYRQRNVSKT